MLVITDVDFEVPGLTALFADGPLNNNESIAANRLTKVHPPGIGHIIVTCYGMSQQGYIPHHRECHWRTQPCYGYPDSHFIRGDVFKVC